MFQQKQFDYSQTPEVQQLYQEFFLCFLRKTNCSRLYLGHVKNNVLYYQKNYRVEKIQNWIRMNFQQFNFEQSEPKILTVSMKYRIRQRQNHFQRIKSG
ncbi:unnamed protein product [Paramecium sonneborni]|uniref:Uncharacterized protein n=1 Tax=Paramecium sonneborni TaxID=65129 RepID=A0A8S1R9I9_9CILI|nr:unnamed protein product [Paramecium sonneborni]